MEFPGLASTPLQSESTRFEFQDVRIIPKVWRPRILTMEIPSLAVARNVDKIVLVDVDAVLARWPNGPILLAAVGL
jgi:hypothetical protein